MKALALLLLVPFAVQSAPLPDAPGTTGPDPGDQEVAAAVPFEAWRFNPRERTARGLAAWGKAKPADAVAPLDSAHRLLPEDPLALYNAGTAHFAAGLDDAESLLERSAQQAPPALAADSHYNLGNSRLAAQNPGGAIDAFKETLRRAPHHAGAKRNLELALRLLEEQQKQQQQKSSSENDGGASDDQQPQEQDGQPGADAESQGEPQPQPSDPPPGENDAEPRAGADPRNSSGVPRERPLPQFEDQQDMTAEQAASILQAVENLERERRREEAKDRARAKTNVEKDW